MADLAPSAVDDAGDAEPATARRRLGPPSDARQSYEREGINQYTNSANKNKPDMGHLGGPSTPATQPAPSAPIRARSAEYGAMVHVSGGGAGVFTNESILNELAEHSDAAPADPAEDLHHLRRVIPPPPGAAGRLARIGAEHGAGPMRRRPGNQPPQPPPPTLP